MTTINYGIDLGTTNSAIAKFDGEELRIYKNKDQMDTTPSAVRVDKNNRVMVGKRAYESRMSGNVATGFKRIMGQSDRIAFENVKETWSPEQLSAEVLKSMLFDARQLSGDAIREAVITVPAAFGQLQCEATSRAAAAAGLLNAPLLQEPIAASIAYGLKVDAHDKRWLVYDLGGGTFDIAVVSTQDGRLTVLESCGDNQLGGKDMDREIVENLLLPKLTREFSLPSLETSAGRRLSYALYRAAEEVKIELSSRQSATASVFEAGVDLDGDEISGEWEISCRELETLVRPLIMKTVGLCRKAMEGARLTKDALSSLILVGGPTLMPITREILIAELGITLEFSIDPMTVVARGAAVFASGLTEREPQGAAIPVSGDVLAEISFDSVSPNETAPVFVKFTGAPAGELEAYFEAEGGHWNSGWLPVDDEIVTVDVPLLPSATTRFFIALRGESGANIAVNPHEFAIRHGLAVGNPPLPHSIGAEVFFTDLERFAVDVLFSRSTPLPVVKTVIYKARKGLRPSDKGQSLLIKLWEGEYVDPESNVWLGSLKIHAEELKRPIPEGAPLEMTITLDASRCMEVHAYVPLIDQHFHQQVFVARENEESFLAKANDLDESVNALYELISEVRENAEKAGDQWALVELDEISAELDASETERAQGIRDADRAKQIVARYKAIRGALTTLEHKVLRDGKSMISLKDMNYWRAAAKQAVAENGNPGEKREYEILSREADAAVTGENSLAMERLSDEFSNLWWRIVQQLGSYWRERFTSLMRSSHRFTDPAAAESLIAQGRQLLRTGSGLELRATVQALWNLLPEEKRSRAREQSDSGGVRKEK